MKQKKPKRKRSVYIPPPDFSQRQLRRCLATLIVGLLLPTLWIVYRYWPPGSAPMPAALLPTAGAPYALGFAHSVALPIIALLTLGLMVLLGKRLFDVETSTASTAMAAIGMMSIGATGMLFVWLYAYVPLVDWLWVKLGGEVGYYQHFSLPRRGSNTRSTPYASGETTSIALWVIIAISASTMDRKSK